MRVRWVRPSIESSDFKPAEPYTGVFGVCMALSLVISALISWCTFNNIWVDNGRIGIIRRFGKIRTKRYAKVGTTTLWPFIEKIDQTIQLEPPAFLATTGMLKDCYGTEVTVTVRINLKYNPKKVPAMIFRFNHTSTFESAVMVPAIEKSIRPEINKIDIYGIDTIESWNKLATTCKDSIITELKSEVERLGLSNIFVKFEPSIRNLSVHINKKKLDKYKSRNSDHVEQPKLVGNRAPRGFEMYQPSYENKKPREVKIYPQLPTAPEMTELEGK